MIGRFRVHIQRPIGHDSVHTAQRAEGGGAEPRGDVARRRIEPDIERSPAVEAQRRPVHLGRVDRGHAGAQVPHHRSRRQRR